MKKFKINLTIETLKETDGFWVDEFTVEKIVENELLRRSNSAIKRVNHIYAKEIYEEEKPPDEANYKHAVSYCEGIVDAKKRQYAFAYLNYLYTEKPGSEGTTPLDHCGLSTVEAYEICKALKEIVSYEKLN